MKRWSANAASTPRGTRHAMLLKEYGLDRPVLVQYGIYIGHVLQGDLGKSIITHEPVMNEFLALFPATI